MAIQKVSGQLEKALRTPSATDVLFKADLVTLFKAAKKPMDLFQGVPLTDAILFTVQCHGLSHGEICFSVYQWRAR